MKMSYYKNKIDMKTFVIIQIIVFSLVSLVSKAQIIDDNSFYYYRGEKQELTTNNMVKYFCFDNKNDFDQLKTLASDYSIIVMGDFQPINEANSLATINPEHHWALIRCNAEEWKLNDVLGSSVASYWGYSSADGSDFGISSKFSVKLKSETDFLVLQNFSNENGAIIVNQDKYMSKWYTLYCPPSNDKTPLELINVFHESSLFSCAQPEFTRQFVGDCVNDPEFGSQWGLDRINACGGWGITMGTSDIIIAVVDHGIDQTHPDLTNNVLTSYYDTRNGLSSANTLYYQLLTDGTYLNHGTTVAGVCAAESNSQFIAGLAPFSKLISISDPMNGGLGTSAQTLANGINYAWKNGADIINCSWHWDADVRIDDAISDAVNFGRSGLGCIVVVAAGNDGESTDPNINFPANSYVSDVIAVGAANQNNEKYNLSNYGEELDVVAPGTQILTTMEGNRMIFKDGTSYATPFVSGLASLILSLNPCLTSTEVKKIICESSQKISSTPYATVKEYGTWNKYFGYGLIDVEAALNSVLNNNYQNETESGTKLYNHVGDIRAGEFITNSNNGPYIVDSGAKIEFKSNSTISLEAGFEVRPEAAFLAHVEQQTENCDNWNSNLLKKGSSTENDNQAVNPPSSIDQSGISNVSLYPNPFQNQFTCQFELQSEESIVLQVYNLLGQGVYSMKLEGQKGLNKVVIDLESTNKIFVIKLHGINSNFSTVLMKN